MNLTRCHVSDAELPHKLLTYIHVCSSAFHNAHATADCCRLTLIHTERYSPILTCMYALGATIGPSLAGISNELGGIMAYIWLQLGIGKLRLCMRALVSLQ